MAAPVRFFGEERRALAGSQEDAFIERIASRVVDRLATAPRTQSQGDKRYVRDVEAAMYLYGGVFEPQGWWSRGGKHFAQC